MHMKVLHMYYQQLLSYNFVMQYIYGIFKHTICKTVFILYA